MTRQDSHDRASDAAAAHRQASSDSKDSDLHEAVAIIVDRILAGKNSTRRA